MDLRHDGVRAILQGLDCAAHDGPVYPRLLFVAAAGFEFADVIAGRKRLFSGSAQDDAAHAVVRAQLKKRVAQQSPSVDGEGIELFGAVQHDGNDTVIALYKDQRLAGRVGASVRVHGASFVSRIGAWRPRWSQWAIAASAPGSW